MGGPEQGSAPGWPLLVVFCFCLGYFKALHGRTLPGASPGLRTGRVSEQEAQVAQGGREQPELELSLKR